MAERGGLGRIVLNDSEPPEPPAAPTMPAISLVLPLSAGDVSTGANVQAYADRLPALGAPAEIVLVGDGTEEVDELCQMLNRRHPEIVRICAEKSRRWGEAIRSGLRAATGDVLAYTNAARTPPEALIAALTYALRDEEVVVRTNRRTRDTLVQKLGSLLFNVECRLVLGVSSWDVNGTPKVFRRSHTRLLELRRADDLIDAEFTVVCERAGYPVIEVAQLVRPDAARRSVDLRAALRMYAGVYQLRREMSSQGVIP
jgi:hypothetical protein